MEMPVEITAHNFELLDHMTKDIHERAKKLEKYYGKIERCHVVVEVPHAHKSRGHEYNFHIRLTLPGAEIVTDRQASEDFNVAARDAFHAARRQLEDYVRVRRGKIKQHESQPTGRIVRLLPEDGYGFIESDDGDEIYFHRNSVTNESFDELAIGTSVRFSAEQGTEGLQASTVTVIR